MQLKKSFESSLETLVLVWSNQRVFLCDDSRTVLTGLIHFSIMGSFYNGDTRNTGLYRILHHTAPWI